MARVTSIHVNSSGRITLYLEGSNPLEDYYPAYHNVSQAQAEKLLAEKGKVHGCTIEGLNYRDPREPMPSDHKTAKRLAKKWNVHLKDKVRGRGAPSEDEWSLPKPSGKARHSKASRGGVARPAYRSYISEVAVKRDPSYPLGQPAPMYLMCPCGARPRTTMRGANITCSCGTVFTADGCVVSTQRSDMGPAKGRTVHGMMAEYYGRGGKKRHAPKRPSVGKQVAELNKLLRK